MADLKDLLKAMESNQGVLAHQTELAHNASSLHNLLLPDIDYGTISMPALPRIPSMWETQAELYMEGLKAQHDELLKTLKDDEQLVMICWHGHERLQVTTINMPSDNVVAMRCIDETGATIQVTGHMNALTFSFRVHKIVPPEVRKPIGFEMPQSE